VKKFLIIIFAGIFVFLNSFNFSAAEISNPDDEDIMIYPETNNIILLDKEDTVFTTKKNEIIFKETQQEILINDYYPSEPIISPDKTRMIYISPFEWEKVGELYMFDTVTKSNEIVFGKKDMPEQNTVKRIYWVNNRYIMLIAGYALGTVSRGGDVYILDTLTGDSVLFYEAKSKNRQEVKEIIFEKDNLIFKIVEFDEEYMDYEVIKKKFDKQKVLKEAENIFENKMNEVIDQQIQLNLLYKGLAPRSPKEVVNTWIRGVSYRNATLQYAVLSPELKNRTKDLFSEMEWVTEISNYFWIDNYNINKKEEIKDGMYEYQIVLNLKNIYEDTFDINVDLIIEKFDNNWFVSSLNSDSDKSYLNIQ